MNYNNTKEFKIENSFNNKKIDKIKFCMISACKYGYLQNNLRMFVLDKA